MSSPSPTVAVTGAGGFVGGAVAADLEAAGPRVVRLARRPIAGHPETVLWDLRREYSGATHLPKVDAIVHCAASLATFDADHTLRAANVDGTRRILGAWPGVPLVFVSSASVYPVSVGGRALREDEAVGEGLHDAYYRSKLEAEALEVGAHSWWKESVVDDPGRPAMRRRASGRGVDGGGFGAGDAHR